MNGEITVQPKASDELKSILSSMDIEADIIRIFISGMGCSGPMFNIAKDEVKDSDFSTEFDGITYVADKALIDEFGGFDVQYLEDDSFHGLYVQPKVVPDMGGCNSCSGCH